MIPNTDDESYSEFSVDIPFIRTYSSFCLRGISTFHMKMTGRKAFNRVHKLCIMSPEYAGEE